MKNHIRSAAIAVTILVGLTSANASTYNVNFSFDSEMVTGTIVTNCDNCFLQTANVSAWSLSFSGTVTGSAGSGPLNQSPPGLFGNVIDATGSHLLYVSGGGGALFTDFASPAQLEFGFNVPDGTIHVQDSFFNTTQGSVAQPFTIATEVVVGTTPLPPALPLFASGLGALGLLGWRRKKKAAALAA